MGQEQSQKKEESKRSHDAADHGQGKADSGNQQAKNQEHWNGRQHVPKGIDCEFRHPVFCGPLSLHPDQSNGCNKWQSGKQCCPAMTGAGGFGYRNNKCRCEEVLEDKKLQALFLIPAGTGFARVIPDFFIENPVSD